MYLQDSRNLGHCLKSNVVKLLSVWDLKIVENIWVDNLRNICCSQVFHGRGFSLELLSRMALLNERIGIWWRWLDVSYRPKTCRQSFGLKQFIVKNYLLNQILTREVCHVTPINKCCGKKPSISHLRMFGCVTRAHISDDYKKKLDANSHTCIMMDYYEELKSYQLFDPVT